MSRAIDRENLGFGVLRFCSLSWICQTKQTWKLASLARSLPHRQRARIHHRRYEVTSSVKELSTRAGADECVTKTPDVSVSTEIIQQRLRECLCVSIVLVSALLNGDEVEISTAEIVYIPRSTRDWSEMSTLETASILSLGRRWYPDHSAAGHRVARLITLRGRNKGVNQSIPR